MLTLPESTNQGFGPQLKMILRNTLERPAEAHG